MTAVITLATPTRYRAHWLGDMAQTAQDTANHPEALELVACIDDDDDVVAYVAALAEQPLPFAYVVCPRPVLSEKWNKAAAAGSGEIIMLNNDDLAFRTPGWDDMVREAFERFDDRICVVYGRDGIEDRCTFPFVHRRWIEVVGRYCSPLFPSDYCDTWLGDVGEMIGRLVFVPEMYIEALHYSVGKSEKDRTHEERLAIAATMDLPGLYDSLLPEREEQARRLRAAMT